MAPPKRPFEPDEAILACALGPAPFQWTVYRLSFLIYACRRCFVLKPGGLWPERGRRTVKTQSALAVGAASGCPVPRYHPELKSCEHAPKSYPGRFSP
jgi:hypothetical protein